MAREHHDLRIVRRLLQHATGYRRQLAGLLVVSLLATPIALLAPVPLKIAVDNVIGSKPVPGYLGFLPGSITSSKNALLIFVVVLVLAVALLAQLQSLTSEALGAYTGEKLKLRFRASLFRHVQRLSLSYHDTRGTSDSLYRIQYDASSIEWVLVQSITPLISAGLMLVGMLYVTSRISPELALIGLAVSPILVLLTALSRRVLRRGWRVERELDSSAMSVVQEVLSGLRVVKTFAQEEREHERFVSRSVLGTRARISLAFREGIFGLLIAMTIAAGTGAALYVGVHQVQSGAITLGSLLLVMAYLAALYAPLQTIAAGIGTLQASLASAERVFAVLDETPDVQDGPSARSIGRADGEIELSAVSFEYVPGKPVLQDVSFRVPVGARVGIAGRTGSGKSTLVSLMTRLHDPTSGSVLLDGLNLRSSRLVDVRNQFAIVLQDTILFSATVAENISYGRPDAAIDEVVAAAEAAGAHEFISRLAEGYDTVVGERGMTLSGGERQRISLARAFLKDAPILILDEPTSAVDTRTEAAMIEAIERLMEGRTVVMIAHRLSTLSNCDLYLELEDGCVTQRSLLREGGRDAVSSRLRIVVTGLIAQHPRLGGVAWDYLAYPLGLARLGHDVYYLEDSGEWPYTEAGGPTREDWIAWDPTPNIRHLAAVMERFGLGDRWLYRFPIGPRWYGLSHRRRREVLSTADLLINVSGTLIRPSDYRSIPRLAYVDSDPAFTQVKLAKPRGQLSFQRRVAAHDVHFSFGERLGGGVPATPYRWLPTRQPVVLSEWQPVERAREAFTTVMSWTSYKPLRFGGRSYGQKDVELTRFAGLPGVVPGARFELALGGTEHVSWQADGRTGSPRDLLRREGWRVVDASRVGATLDSYRSYLRSSKAEWSVAKGGYVTGETGSFSCRSACYLAAGRPVVVQDTGFRDVLPTGEGIVPFSSLAEAADAVEDVLGRYRRHADAAREIAVACFDSDLVLGRLVDEAMAAPAASLEVVA